MTTPCHIAGCDKVSIARSMCSAHYNRWRRSTTGQVSTKPVNADHVTATRGICEVDGCDRPHKARGMCRLHYKYWQRKQARA